MKKNKWIGYILTAICMVLCLYSAIEVIVASNQKRPPSFFGVSISNVPTHSMEDTIQAGDYVLFKKVNFEDVQLQDIIVYRSKEGDMAGNFIIHRVVEVHEDYLVTQGDNLITNPVPDAEKITPDMVYGRYIGVLGFMKIFSGVHRSAAFIILFLIVLFVIILQAVSIYLKYKKAKLEQQQKSIDLEQLKKEILEEELEKLKNQNKNSSQ